MIDIGVAINYLKQVVESLESEKTTLDKELEDLKIKKNKLLVDNEELIASRNSFYSQTQSQTIENDRYQKMHDLAIKMKIDIDERKESIKSDLVKMAKREKAVSGLEKKQKQLNEKEKILDDQEKDIEERELFIKKQTLALREKQEDLELKEKAIKKKQERLQKMIDAQAL